MILKFATLIVRGMDLGIFPWFSHESFMHKLCFFKIALPGCWSQIQLQYWPAHPQGITGERWELSILSRKKMKISENMFGIAWVVDLFLMEHHFPRENTVNIVNFGCCLSQKLSDTGSNSLCWLTKPSSTGIIFILYEIILFFFFPSGNSIRSQSS